MRIHQNRKRTQRLAGCLVLASAAGLLCLVAALMALWVSSGDAAPGLKPAERLALAAYLTARDADLARTAGADPAPVDFTIESGETANGVARRLAAQKLVSDSTLLSYYMHYTGLDLKIEAGDFVLRQTMTLKEVAQTLTDANARQISIRIFEGWRLGQIVAALSGQSALAVSEQAFLALAGPNGHPPSGYAFLDGRPAGASLEGFLFPDTYLVLPGATADDVVNKMLTNFQAHLPADYVAAVAGQRLDLYEAVIIASLIEREAVVDDERPEIAAVILNRLAIGQPLEIDATVQYVVGTSENWWPPLSGLDFRSIENPYNTYFVKGLPAGPIANPGLSSLLAVAHPAQSRYLYYRALCDGSGRHAFATTYEEHLANACP
jgi:UPF0755 protein